ncbi:hypothetical protein CO165_02815 [Candidatus Roizmanbacteria bacterium CG_4_9_14_3_um_filter_33_18]|uniref:Homing endonuclease LAGLIDADG domain-containing protein n=1 Tax=Candidatus Roizmanbacteria bacterium CG_4_9_14_3_um_filter_33_18 TaxID=1974841 RepID=A0A2M7XXY3_9BACT|nr:MAG: hypothetical protein CO165_02815 [Candidatus Roizmanbacteria bacterium CG_4_9_14_3_um_filter_33_18]
MKKNLFYAYLAGFLDTDGSIYVRLKPNSSYKYDFQISPSIVFFQKNTAESYFKKIQKKLNYSKKRKICTKVVCNHLIEKGVLTP